MVESVLKKSEAIEYLQIDAKQFENYQKFSGEIVGTKAKGRWHFSKNELDRWKKLKDERTVLLTRDEYEKCFELAIKMAYGSKSSHGTGIRGTRSEMQLADDWILGILAEFGLMKLLKDRFGVEIKLDTEAHPEHITAQDIVGVKEGDSFRNPNLNVGIKASKIKNCFLVLPEIEYKKEERKSDVYVFVRVGLPSDHLFRILREHSFFKTVTNFLEKNNGFRKIEQLSDIPVWICGFVEHKDLDKVTEIPGQKFDNGFRYVKSVADLQNDDASWNNFITRL